MSSFSALESSVESSRPIELYEFILGTDFFRYTSAEDAITIGADTYEPIAIARSKIVQGADQNNRNVTVDMPGNNPFASQYVTIPPGIKATVNIFRYQRDEVPSFDTQILMFKGQVQSVRFPNDGYGAQVAVRSIETSLNQNVPRFTFMGMCNHILYDAFCGVSEANFDHIGNADLVATTFVTISGAAASGIDFVGGYCTPTGVNDFRMIISQSGDIMELLLPFASDPTSTSVQAFAGCDHVLTSDCALVFDNVAEFGGFAFVPNKNLFQTGLD